MTTKALGCGGTMSVTMVLMVFTTGMVSSAQSSLVVFHVSEELPSGTPVGNVQEVWSSKVREAGGEDAAELQLQFHILRSPNDVTAASVFTISNRTGVLSTAAVIDREQICDLRSECQVDLDVAVKTNVTFVGLVTVKVIVDDVNDNAPTFPEKEITLVIPESTSLNSDIPIPGAFDRDTGLNAAIQYTLPSSDHFSLREVRQLDGSAALSLLVQRELDRETTPSLTFLLLASDGWGPRSLTGTLTIHVQIADVNDNAPQFTTDVYNFTVAETALVGTTVGHVTASDDDVGSNGDVSYRFSARASALVEDLFSINVTSGEIVVVAGGGAGGGGGGLRYQSGRSFNAVVEAVDHGVPAKLSQAVVEIHVEDVGNTPPRVDLVLADPLLSPPHTTALMEDAPLGSFVGTLRVEDVDKGVEGKVACSSLEPHFNVQELDSSRHSILLSQSLDHEEKEELVVPIVCIDGGIPQLTSSTSFRVVVRDVNDHVPEFEAEEVRVSIVENGAGEVSVVKVKATDRDGTAVTYHLGPGSPAHFTIRPSSGWIVSRLPLDREATPYFSLFVLAVDSGTPSLTATATVFVTVDDVNDNPPRVDMTDYYVNESARAGHVIPVRVTDEDKGENGTVTVTMMMADETNRTSNSTPFDVLNNGSLVVLSPLDRESRDLYTVVVVLTDHGPTPLSSITTLIVHVQDDNDHTPQFLFPSPGNSSVSVASGAPAGWPVCQIIAADEDAGLNAQITYSLNEDIPTKGLFGINRQSGDIFLTGRLHNFATTTIRLSVTATDQGSPPLSNSTTLEIYVTDGYVIANNVSLAHGDGGPDKANFYGVIAGVISGTTFVISAVIIGAIFYLRCSNIRRLETARQGKEKKAVSIGFDKNTKSLKALTLTGVVTAGEGEKTGEGCGSRECHRDASLHMGGFEHRVLSSVPDGKCHDGGLGCVGGMADAQFQSTLSMLKEQNSRGLPAEDVGSDTSGETTTWDSGRGASIDDIVLPWSRRATGTPLSSDVTGTSTSRPYVKASNHVTDKMSRYVTQDFFDTHHSYPSSAVFESARPCRAMQRVHFSLDNHPSDGSLSHSFYSTRNPYLHNTEKGDGNANVSTFGFDVTAQPLGSDGRNGWSTSLEERRECLHGARLGGRGSENVHFSSRDVHNEAGERQTFKQFYPRAGLFPWGQEHMALALDAEVRLPSRALRDSTDSLSQGIEDDVSTTTSGSYSIDTDDVATSFEHTSGASSV